MKTCIGIVLCALSLSAYAQNIVDVYGTTPIKAESILNKYGKKIALLEEKFQKEIKPNLFDNDSNSESEKEIENKINKLVEQKFKLIEKIKKEGKFLFVNFQAIWYPENVNQYTTIDVVEKDQSERLKYVEPIRIQTSNEVRDDLVNQMIEFFKKQMKIIYNDSYKDKKYDCPVYHCIGRFDDPNLKPYLSLFNKGAIQQKALILRTLKIDSNPERREAAVFLVGHFKNPEEIINTLMPYVEDKYSGVRNNAMRVIGSTLFKSNIKDVDSHPFLRLIDSTEITDRNKALLILSHLANFEGSRKIILQQAGTKLINLLRLKQLNNHEPAYDILKKISGKNFAEYDIVAWENWLKSTSVSS